MQKITLKDKGVATMGGRKIWFDTDIQRLNVDGRGLYLGEFLADESLLAVNRNGSFYTTNFDLSNRYPQEIRIIEKLIPEKIYTAIYYDGGSGYFYLKRFRFEISENLPQSFISEAEGSYLVDISEDTFPRIQITFTGKHEKRPAEILDAVAFINDKSFRAKGKRITTFEVGKIEFIEPATDPDESGNNGNEEDMDFELEGPVLPGETPSASAAGEKPSTNFNDEDAYQMTLL